MFKRPLFWLGLVVCSLASFGSLLRRPVRSQAPHSELFTDLIDDALIVCDSTGTITETNVLAEKLFGPSGTGINGLSYPNGQAVPPGQLPLNRALRTGNLVVGAGYRSVGPDGLLRVLNVRAQLLPQGGAAAVFRNVTALQESMAREGQSQGRQRVIQQLCSRLSKATTAGEMGRAAVESVRLLLETMPDVQIRLYSYNPITKTLTCLAADPDDQLKRPITFGFDATIPILWQLYIERLPSSLPPDQTLLDEASSASHYALPLLIGGAAIGHLSLGSREANLFDDPTLQETLGVIASLAALALARPQSLIAADALRAQSEAIYKVAQAVSGGLERNRLADVISELVRRITGAEVCALSVPIENKLTVLGEVFRDDLLFPESVKPDDSALHGKAVAKALRTQKTVSQPGNKNPSFEAGPWRAFAGRAGQHSMIAVPLADRQGVLTVYTDGTVPLPESQVKFLETIAALLSMADVTLAQIARE